MVYCQISHIRVVLLRNMRESADCVKGNGEIIRKMADYVL